MKAVFAVFLVFLFPFSSTASEWSNKTMVKVIYTGYKEGIIMFTTTESAHHNPKGCNADLYTVSKEEADINMMFSTLLAAQRSNAEVQIGVDSSKCGSVSHAMGRINVTRIKVLN